MRKLATKLASLLLTACACFGLAACGTTQKPPTPAPSGTLTADAARDEYRKQADDKISEILSVENTTVPDDATVYYLSNDGNDSNNGLSPDKAWKTLDKLNKTNVPEGAYILFERGGVWRGKIDARKGVTYTAYGDEANDKPCIYGSPENGAVASKWVKTSTANVWRYTKTFDEDVGTIVFDEGDAFGVKAMVSYADGKYYNATRFKNNKTSQKDGANADAWAGLGELKEDLDFWHNDVSFASTTADNYVYLYSETNPGERFFSIEFNVKHHLMNVECDDVTIDNLCFKYTGAHGVSGVSPVNLTVQNCEFGWIGGSLMTSNPSESVRYGNAVQIWNACDGFYVKNNYIYQVYDTAITPQGTEVQLKNLVEKDIYISENVIEYCNWALEFFITANENSYAHYENVNISKNHIWYTGYGLSEQRSDLYDNGCIYFVRGTWHNQMADKIKITENVMAMSRLFIVNTQYSAPSGPYKDTTGFIYSGNIFIDYEAEAESVDNTAIGWGGVDFLGSDKRYCVIREWVGGSNRWSSYYDELQFFNQDFADYVNSFADGGKENTCYFLQK